MSAPVLTPDGHKYDPVDPQDVANLTDSWLQAIDYPNLVAYANDPAKQPFLAQYILDACSWVNRYCDRKFNYQIIDQIIPNKLLTMRDYTTFALWNQPLVAVQNVWVEVVDTFNLVDPHFLQVLTREGVIKFLPSFSVYVQTTLPMWALPTTTNIWIRYASGFATPANPVGSDNSADGAIQPVPQEVKRATALIVDYLFGLDQLTPNISAFRTQTYSQNNAKIDEDPILTRAMQLLNRFKNNTIC